VVLNAAFVVNFSLMCTVGCTVKNKNIECHRFSANILYEIVGVQFVRAYRVKMQKFNSAKHNSKK
jgi:hypothetical protein